MGWIAIVGCSVGYKEALSFFIDLVQHKHVLKQLLSEI